MQSSEGAFMVVRLNNKFLRKNDYTLYPIWATERELIRFLDTDKARTILVYSLNDWLDMSNVDVLQHPYIRL